ncbi:MAG: hypothetical protein Q9206_002656, partial [Seirophora lacunosa]
MATPEENDQGRLVVARPSHEKTIQVESELLAAIFPAEHSTTVLPNVRNAHNLQLRRKQLLARTVAAPR